MTTSYVKDSTPSTFDFCGSDDEKMSGIQESNFQVSTEFCRSNAELRGIARARAKAHAYFKASERCRRREASKERTLLRKYYEAYESDDNYHSVEEFLKSDDMKKVGRSHPKRHERAARRRAHADLLKARMRHRAYLKRQQQRRREAADSDMDVEMFSVRPTAKEALEKDLKAFESRRSIMTPDPSDYTEDDMKQIQQTFVAAKQDRLRKVAEITAFEGTPSEEKVQIFAKKRSHSARPSSKNEEKKEVAAKVMPAATPETFFSGFTLSDDLASKITFFRDNIREEMKDLENSSRYEKLCQSFNQFTQNCKSKVDDFSERFSVYVKSVCENPTIKEIASKLKVDDGRLISNIVSTICFVRLTLRAEGSVDYSMLTFLYLRSCGVSLKWTAINSVAVLTATKLIQVIVDAAKQDVDNMRVESLSDTLDGFLQGSLNFLNNPFVMGVKNLVVFMAALHLFDKPIASTVFKQLGKPEGVSFISLITTALADLVRLAKAAEQWFFGKPGDFKLFEEADMPRALNALKSHLDRSEFIYTGLHIEGYMDRNLYITTLIVLIKDVEDAKVYTSKGDQKKLDVEKHIKGAKKVLLEFKGAAMASFRATPLGIVIHGKPGVGKSHVLKFLCYIHSILKGRKFTEGQLYTRQGEFWENYSPFSHPYIHYSEAGKMKASRAEAKGDETMDEILSVADNLPYPVNMAFEGKGKVFALPEMLLIDTNNPDLNFFQMYNNPAAFRRRFIFVEVQVKKEWSTTGKLGGDFDTSKPGASTAGTDAWVFNVRRYKPKTNVESDVIDIATGVDSSEFIKVMTALFVRHIQYEESVLANVTSGSMFSKHEAQIIEAASGFVALQRNVLKISEDDDKVEYHQDSVYARIIESGPKIRDLVSRVIHKGDPPCQTDVSIPSVEVPQDHVKVVATFKAASVPSTGKIPDVVLPESVSLTDLGGLLDGASDSISFDVEDEKEEVMTKKPLTWSILTALASSPESWQHGKSEYLMEEYLHLIASFVPSNDITNYARHIGMYSNLKIAVVRVDGRMRISVLEKTLLSKDFVHQGYVFVSNDKLQVENCHIWNFILRAMDSHDLIYGIVTWMKQHPSVREEMQGEFGIQTSLLGLFGTAGWSLLAICVLYCWYVLTLPGNSMQNANTKFRISFVVYTLGCLYFKQMWCWILFVTFAMVTYNVTDDLRGNLSRSIRAAMVDAFDTFGFSWGQIEQRVQPNRQDHVHVPRRNYWIFTALVKLSLVGGTTMVVYKGLTSLFEPKKSKIVHVVHHEEELPKKLQKVESAFSKPSAYDADILARENSYHCGNSYSRIPNKLDPSKWNVKLGIPPKFTGSAESFRACISSNIRYCCIKLDGGRERRGHVFGICENYALTHLHGFEGSPLAKTILVSQTGSFGRDIVTLPTVLDSNSFVVLDNDLVLIRLNSIRFTNVLQHMCDESDLPDLASGEIHETKVSTITHHSRRVVKDAGRDVVLNHWISYRWDDHSAGCCGIPLSVAIGSGWKIAGLHVAGGVGDSSAAASAFPISQIRTAMKNIEGRSMLCPLASSELEFVTEEPYPKSVARYVEMNGANYFGKLPGPVNLPSESKVKPTGLNSNGEVEEMFDSILDHKVKTKYGPPPMKGFRKNGQWFDPDVRFASKVGQQKKCLWRPVLEEVIDEYASRIVDGFKAKGRDLLQPWDLDTAINGAIQDAYARKMDLNKASGYGKIGKKINYFDILHSDGVQKAEAVQELRKEVLEALQFYDQGISRGVVFEACLKDEPRDLEKCAIGKTRTFCVSPLVNLIITRMFFGPIFSTMVEDGDLFCVGIGSDMHRDADDMYHKIADHSPNVGEFDYGNYDQAMPYEIGWAAGSVVYQICKRLGYTPEALKVVSGLVSDNLHPFVSLKKDLFELVGYQPSGKFGTAEDNSIRGVIMIMYAWKILPTMYRDADPNAPPLNFEGKIFFLMVVIIVYGDDVIISVHTSCSDFNNFTYAAFCKEVYGLDCTPASKGANFAKFVTPDTMMFLKRTFKKHPEFDRIVAPLDLDSLAKTLSWHIPSASVSKEDQILSACDSVVREIFFHTGKEKFDTFVLELTLLLSTKLSIPIERIIFPTYYTLAEHTLCSTSRSVVEGGQNVLTESRIIGKDHANDWFEHKTAQEAAPALKVESGGSKSGHRDSSIDDFNEWTSESLLALRFQTISEFNLIDERIVNEFRLPSLKQFRYGEESYLIYEVRQLVDRAEALLATVQYIDYLLNHIHSDLKVESEILDSNSLDTEEKMQNVRDLGGDQAIDRGLDNQFDMFDIPRSDMHVDKFLSRPLKIASVQMTLDTPFSQSFDLYSLLLASPNYRSKLRNFAQFKADICVRIAVSGTSFHQGRLLCAWVPWYNKCQSAQYALTYPGDSLISIQYLSTQKVQGTIDIKSNEPLNLRIPFLHVKPMGRLYNNSSIVLGAATAFDDFADMGKLYINSIGVPESVSATATNPYLYVYAWFENPVYTLVSGTKMALNVESDERRSGPAENLARKVAQIADSFAAVPILDKYAKATSLAASAGAEIAALHGWSKPAIISNPERVKNEPFACAANVALGELSHKVTLYRDQQLTVDGSVLGTTEDELSIRSMCEKEFFLDRADWTTGATILTPFWLCPINPRVSRIDSLGAVYLPSPMSLTSSLFDKWHGDITFRFDVVKTTFHKGKFAIFWEPNGTQNVLINGSISMNAEYMYVVDIQELENFEITVKWAFHQAWANIPTLPDSLNAGNLTATTGRFFVDCCNGYLGIVPITSLQAPLDKSVHINIYIKSHDMHFNYATTGDFNNGVYTPVVPELKVESMSSVPNIDINTGGRHYRGISEYHYGEEPVSLRALLKRFVTFKQINVTDPAPVSKQLKGPLWPFLDPPNASSVSISADQGVLGILRYCFVGIRGGMKYRIRINSSAGNSMAVQAGNSLNVGLLKSSTSLVGDWTQSLLANYYLNLEGTTTFVPYTQPGVEVEIPNYMTALWAFAQLDNPLPNSDYYVDPDQVRGWYIDTYLSNSDAATIFLDRAVGEDFSLLHFLASPLLKV